MTVKLWKHLRHVGDVKEKHNRFFLFVLLSGLLCPSNISYNEHIWKGPWNLRSANGDLLVHRNLANSGTKGECSAITFALSTCIDFFFNNKKYFTTYLLFYAYCNLKIFFPLAKVMERLCIFPFIQQLWVPSVCHALF